MAFTPPPIDSLEPEQKTSFVPPPVSSLEDTGPTQGFETVTPEEHAQFQQQDAEAAKTEAYIKAAEAADNPKLIANEVAGATTPKGDFNVNLSNPLNIEHILPESIRTPLEATAMLDTGIGGKAAQLILGGEKSGAKGAAGLTSPLGVAATTLAPVPIVGPAVVSAFAIKAASELPSQAAQLGKQLGEGDIRGAAETAGDIGQAAALISGARHLNQPKTVLPKSAEALSKIPTVAETTVEPPTASKPIEAQPAPENALNPTPAPKETVPSEPSPAPLGITPPGTGKIQAVLDTISELPTGFKDLAASAAGESAPKTSNRAVESGNALVRFASAKIAAPQVAKSLVTDVLGDQYKDPVFSEKLGAVLVEDRLRAIEDSFRQAGDTASADAVETIIGKKDSPLKTQADFDAALNDPKIQEAIQRHKDTVQETATQMHEETGGKLAGPGLRTGAFVNLKALFDGADEIMSGGGRGNLENFLRRKTKFGQQATGTAENYELNYRTLGERMIEANYSEYAKRQMYDQLVKDGLAQYANPGDPIPDTLGKKPVRFRIERKGTPAGEGKARTYLKDLWVNRDIAQELRNAENVDGPIERPAALLAVNILNKLQLAGPTDAAWHIGNMLSSISGSQGGKSFLVDVLRKVPGVNVADTIGRVWSSAAKVLKDTPEIQAQIADLAKIGAMRGDSTHMGFSGKLIGLLDKAGRLVRDDLYQNLVDRGLVENTEANRREWVNQLGQYNPRLMGQFQRFFKEAGISPFIVAGRNFNRMGIRKVTLSPGIKASTLQAAAALRAVEAVGVVTTLFAIPALLNFLTTGNPTGRPGTKVGQIDTGKNRSDGSLIVIDPAQWIGLRRGMRITGINAVSEGLRKGESQKTITKNAIRDVLGGIIHPWSGPAVNMASVAVTGYSPTLYKESKVPGDFGENFLAALKQVNPLVASYFKGKEKDTGSSEPAFALAGAVGVKSVKPETAQSQVFSKVRNWMEASTDPKVKRMFELRQSQNFGESEYKDLRIALQNNDMEKAKAAYDELRKIKDPKTINLAMRPHSENGPKPFTGSREMERKFVASLKPEDRKIYQDALAEREEIYRRFVKLKK